MPSLYSIAFRLPASRFLAAALGLLLAGCASVSSTSIYYLPVTTETFPPKPPDAPIPILGKAPDRPYKVIGRMSFASSQGWKFLRESMLYNARANGADAVILRDTFSKNNYGRVFVPPQMNYVPIPGPVWRGRGGRYCGGTAWVPQFQPGYSYPTVQTLTGIDAEMIIFRR